MCAARLERKGHTVDGSTYTFEAIATLLGFGAGHAAKMVVLALYFGVFLMMEGCLLVSESENQAGQSVTYRDCPIAS